MRPTGLSLHDLYITSIQAIPGPTMVIGFQSVAGAVHFLNQATDLSSGVWSTPVTNIAGTAGILYLTNSVPPGASQLFFRIGGSAP
jgi:hypothetical protein